MALTTIFVYHGGQEAFGWFGGSGWHATVELWTSAKGLNLPYLAVVALIVSQLAVSLSLFFGFLTRLAGLAVAVLMGVSMALMESDVTFDQLSLPGLILVVGLGLAFIGGGYFSVDRGIASNLLPEVG